MPSGLFNTIIIRGFQTTNAYMSLDLTKAKCSITRMSKVEKDVIMRISHGIFSACEKIDMKIK
jgi:hypothetical protein